MEAEQAEFVPQEQVPSWEFSDEVLMSTSHLAQVEYKGMFDSFDRCTVGTVIICFTRLCAHPSPEIFSLHTSRCTSSHCTLIVSACAPSTQTSLPDDGVALLITTLYNLIWLLGESVDLWPVLN